MGSPEALLLSCLPARQHCSSGKPVVGVYLWQSIIRPQSAIDPARLTYSTHCEKCIFGMIQWDIWCFLTSHYFIYPSSLGCHLDKKKATGGDGTSVAVQLASANKKIRNGEGAKKECNKGWCCPSSIAIPLCCHPSPKRNLQHWIGKKRLNF